MAAVQKPQFKRQKKRLSDDQLRLLESSFSHDSKLEPEKKLQLARDLGLLPRQVAVWYQNKRARWRTRTLELDYKAARFKLEAALTEKKVLEKEVEKLRVELDKAHQMLGLKDNLFSAAAFTEEEGESALLPAEVAVEEFYVGMMGVHFHDVFGRSDS